jgi:hypothetical protein
MAREMPYHSLSGSTLLFLSLTFLLLLAGCSPLSTTNTQPCRLSTCATSIPGTVSGDVVGVRSFVDTWNNIHLFQNFDHNINNPSSVAKYYDSVWAANVDRVNTFRSGDPNIFLGYYILFHRDSGTFFIRGPSRDLAYWQRVHPDWILYTCDRQTHKQEFGDPNVPFDFSNPALVSWQIETYAQPASISGFDGIAADNVNLENLFGACGVCIHGQWVQRFTVGDVVLGTGVDVGVNVFVGYRVGVLVGNKVDVGDGVIVVLG